MRPTNGFQAFSQSRMETSVTSVVSHTLMRCLLTHLVKVFFCTLSRSSKEHREKREVNDMFELHTTPQWLELYYLCQLVRKKNLLDRVSDGKQMFSLHTHNVRV